MAAWWQSDVVYQIYPRSFNDSNADGIGDLLGIVEKLDYLSWLGVGAIWISPMYPSPMADFGYDVMDYRDVDPIFGTLKDMQTLIDEAHRKDLKIILDFVPNHTSDQHPWFIESRSSRDNPKRDWYIWKDAKADGSSPTNWLSRFDGKSAWQWDETTEQYYLHSFLAEQPDVNWRNVDLREAMLDVIRFWYERGVDGFRVDVSYRVMKDAEFRDNPPNPDFRPDMDPHNRLLETYSKNTPDIHSFNRWLRKVNDEFAQRVLIGEINLPIEKLVKHYGANDEFHLPFNFHLIQSEWDSTVVDHLISAYEAALPEEGWPNWVLGNHDVHRVASRVGENQARVAMMLLLTLRGTPTMYYGDELGMVDGDIPPDKVQDPWEKFVPGKGLGRDPERTPMQWTAEAHAGFTQADVVPWLPVNPDFEQVNVVVQRSDPDSMLSLTKRLLTLRRETPALSIGSYQPLPSADGLVAYARTYEDNTMMVVLNFTTEDKEWLLPYPLERVVPMMSTHFAEDWSHTVGPDIIMSDHVHLKPNEGLILRVT